MIKNITIEIGDITKLDCDCIVNAANRSLCGGGGVDGAIHRAAGPQLLKECIELRGCNTGEAKITKGYQLKAKHIIHTVGPVYSGKPEDEELLAGCYRKSLELAKENGLHSIAFPAIFTGAYRYPLDKACAVALSAISAWIQENAEYEMQVIMCCFDKKTYNQYERILKG
ncbi:MAG: O-acetyl-ADP-ribose deacetylase [Lachnospiraceae bacterium]|nr:O-acetyl-ADP-ribose deacetylase [Lachnospiraceae bacterium]